MQYIALAFDTPETLISKLTSELNELANNAGYQPMTDWLEMPGDGLASFVQTCHITRLVYLNFPSRKSLKFSSNGISEDLFNSVFDERPSVFELFLTNVSKLFHGQSYYIIFGEEWFIYSYVRYYEGPLAKLSYLLQLNKGWQTQLYNFETASYSSDSETPLIFRVISDV